MSDDHADWWTMMNDEWWSLPMNYDEWRTMMNDAEWWCMMLNDAEWWSTTMNVDGCRWDENCSMMMKDDEWRWMVMMNGDEDERRWMMMCDHEWWWLVICEWWSVTTRTKHGEKRWDGMVWFSFRSSTWRRIWHFLLAALQQLRVLFERYINSITVCKAFVITSSHHAPYY